MKEQLMVFKLPLNHVKCLLLLSDYRFAIDDGAAKLLNVRVGFRSFHQQLSLDV
jgi:hypothetical protein